MHYRNAISAVICCALAAWTAAAHADETLGPGDFATDAKLYFTAPLRWDSTDWLYFAGAASAVALSHSLDGRVRDHFAPAGSSGLSGQDLNSTRDAVPAVVLVAGTLLAATIMNDQSGRVEVGTMLEAAGLSVVTAEGLKFAAGRVRPDSTVDPNDWREGGSSFPSLHVDVAFAVGTVFAESGSDDYRWVRRIVGYGMAMATTYARVHDNAHWLSDTVAGAALGIATARFTVGRRIERASSSWQVSVGPADGGLKMSFQRYFN